MRDVNSIYNIWKSKVTDSEMQNELLQMQNNQEQINLAFSQDLQFGTAGLRGIMGVGTAKINLHTITKTTVGIANYLLLNSKKPFVVVAYDNRKNSQKFAELVCQIFSDFKIKTFLFDRLTPTPVLSFMVRKLGANLGVNITSSHNPKEYNGYKVVNGAGFQISTNEGVEMQKYILQADAFYEPKDSFQLCLNKGKIELLLQDQLDEFVNLSVKNLNTVKTFENGFNVTYSPLNGSGMLAMNMAFNKIGLKHYFVPAVENFPDPNFVAVPYPNPEMLDVYKNSLKLAKQKKSAIIVTTDPDADRLGVMVKHGGKYEFLKGDEIGAILLSYQIEKAKQNNTLNKNSFFVTSVVSGPLSVKIAEQNNVLVFKTLTGFKNIGGKVEEVLNLQVDEYKQNNNKKLKASELHQKAVETANKNFLFAYEESNGFMVSDFIRDKDAFAPTLNLVLLANQLFANNKTLIDYLNELYKTYGTVITHSFSKSFAGENASQKMQSVVEALRKNLPHNICGFNVLNVVDYLNTNKTKLESSNFISFDLENNIRVIVRPSGTEPKLKAYLSVEAVSKSLAYKTIAKLEKFIAKKLFK